VITLQRQGYTASTKAVPDGKTVVFAGPYKTWGQASNARLRLASTFPDALIVP
jgi:hypothetical protein